MRGKAAPLIATILVAFIIADNRPSVKHFRSVFEKIFRNKKDAPDFESAFRIFYLLILPSFFSLLCPLGEDAAAVILAVQPVFAGELRRAQVAAALFEVVVQPQNAALLLQFFPDLVEPRRVFVRADGEGGTEVRIAALLRRAGCAGKAQHKAGAAARAALRLPFQPLCGGKELGGVVVAVEAVRPAHFAQQAQLLRLAVRVLGGVGDVGVIVKYGDAELFFQLLDAAGGTRPAAAVQQQARPCGRGVHLRAHHLVEIRLVHAPIVAQNRGKGNAFSLYTIKILYQI